MEKANYHNDIQVVEPPYLYDGDDFQVNLAMCMLMMMFEP